MPPAIPNEMIGAAAELAVYFVTLAGALLSFLLTARA
jgi:hypothetical protein